MAAPLPTCLLAALALLTGCGIVPIGLDSRIEAPGLLSRLTVHNQFDGAAFLRATWIEGKEEVSLIPPGPPQSISGSIAGAFPTVSVEVLADDCTVLHEIAGMPWDTERMLSITADEVSLDPITRGDPSWGIAQTTDRCRTKPHDLGPGDP